MKQSMIDILNDDDKLNDYILSLEEELLKSEDVDQQVDLILNNILDLYDNFKNRKALKASNIDAITNLLKFKADLPMKRIQVKKTLLDMLTKKQELEIKNKTADSTGQLADSASELLTAIFYKLDQRNIHPDINENILNSNGYKEIIDKPESKIENTENCDTEIIDIASIQKELDEETGDE